MTSATIQFFENALLTSRHFSSQPGESLDISIHRYTDTMEQLSVECITCLEAFKDDSAKISQFEKEFTGIRNHLTATALQNGVIDGDVPSSVSDSIRNRALYLVNYRIVGTILAALKEMKGIDAEKPVADEAKPTAPVLSSDDENLIKGVRGLATHLGCAVNTAQEIVNSKILQEHKILYYAGRTIRVKKNKLDTFLQNNPDALKKVRRAQNR